MATSGDRTHHRLVPVTHLCFWATTASDGLNLYMYIKLFRNLMTDRQTIQQKLMVVLSFILAYRFLEKYIGILIVGFSEFLRKRRKQNFIFYRSRKRSCGLQRIFFKLFIGLLLIGLYHTKMIS